MKIKGTRDLTVPCRIFMVLACACMTGFMWRVRGDYGWGSMWGMFSVGIMLVLFIYAFFGNRRKISYESIPAAVILLGITNGGWGTLNQQLSGYLQETTIVGNEWKIESVPVSAASGLIIMLLLGLSWMPLFSIFIASLFSDKKYGIKHYAVLIGIFYAVSLIFQFSASHFILAKICPQATEAFAKSLAAAGIGMSPLKAYAVKLGSISWAKNFLFGRNYFTSIVVISRAAGAIICSLSALIIFKDRLTSLVSMLINIVSAIAITAADFPLIAGSDRGFFIGKHFPAFFTANAWNMWEFLTGFFFGFGFMLILVCLPGKVLNGEGKFKAKSVFANPAPRYIYNSIFVLFFSFGVVTVRPLGYRISQMLFEAGKISYDNMDKFGAIIAVILGIPALIICLIIAKKNILTLGLQVPVAARIENFSMKATPAYFLVNALLYFFTGNRYILKLPFGEMNSFAAVKTLIANGTLSVFVCALASVILFYVFFFIAKKICIKEKRR